MRIGRPPAASRLLPSLGVLASLAGPPALAQTPPAGGMPPTDFSTEAALGQNLTLLDRSAQTIMAEVGTRAITAADVADAIRAMPPVVGSIPFMDLVRNAIVQLAQTKALANAAAGVGLDKIPAVARRMGNAADEALANEMLRRSLAPNLSDGSLRAV